MKRIWFFMKMLTALCCVASVSAQSLPQKVVLANSPIPDSLLYLKPKCDSIPNPSICRDCYPYWVAQNANSAARIPETLCDCMTGDLFYSGKDTVFSGVSWMKTRIDSMLNRGLTAYWFSSDSVLIDIYPDCFNTFGTPLYSVYVYWNNARMLSPEHIMKVIEDRGMKDLLNAYLREAGAAAYIKITPVGEGRAMLYTYGDGFHSTCDDIYPVYFRVPYAMADPDNVYELSAYRARNLKFIRWEPIALNPTEQRGPVTVSIRKDSCSGPIVATYTLQDTTRVWFVDSLMLSQATSSYKKPLYLHFESNSRGIITCYNGAFYRREQITDSICHGKIFEYGEYKLTEDTVFSDTLTIYKDTFLITDYRIHFTEPSTAKTVNLNLSVNDFPYNYYGNPVSEYGEKQMIKRVDGECDELVKLVVNPKWTVIRQTVDTSICKGKYIYINDKRYTSNATVRDTVDDLQSGTRTITTYSLKFPMQTEYDTIRLAQTDLPYSYQSDYGTKSITKFGSTTLTFQKSGQCTYRVQVLAIDTTPKPVEPPIDVPTALEGQTTVLVEPTIAKAGEPILITIDSQAIIEVMDVLGRMLIKQPMEHAAEITIPAAGHYLIRINHDGATVTKRILITN